MEFAPFDRRHYPTLSVRDGYREWASTYEGTVQDEMDLRLLERITSIPWASIPRALDLACGTGRVGAWLKQVGVRQVDGIDLTREMLNVAADKEVYDELFVGDVRDTGLESSTYELLLQVLADEHLRELLPLYEEARRLARSSGYFVVVGYHPHFLLSGIPTHFDRPTGESVAIESFVHLLSDHVKAAHQANWLLLEMDEGVVDEAWLEKKPKWQPLAKRPVSFSMVWRAKM